MRRLAALRSTLADDKNRRRTVYSFVSRRKLDATLATVRFPERE